MTILATGGYGRAYFSCTSAHSCTGDGNAMVLRAGVAAAGHGVRAVSSHRHLRRRLPDHRGGARGEGGYLLPIPRASASWSATRRERQGSRLARRRQPRDDSGDPRGPRCRRRARPPRAAPGSNLGPAVIHERLPGIAETARIFSGVDVTKEADPGAADGASTTWAASPVTITARCCSCAMATRRRSCPASWRSERRRASRCTAPTAWAATRSWTWWSSVGRRRGAAPRSSSPASATRLSVWPRLAPGDAPGIARLDHRLRNANGNTRYGSHPPGDAEDHAARCGGVPHR